MAAALRELLEKYRKFVIDNVETIGHVESSARILSYIAPGGTATSSEFLSAVVSLVVLVNDSILRSAASMPLNFADAEKKMAFCLTVIEYVEVFLEMAAYGQNRNVARWLVVVGVQIVKAVLRFLLLLKYNVGIVASSPVPALRRGKELMMRIRENHGTTPSSSHQVETTTTAAAASVSGQATFSLKSTGRTVRSLAADLQPSLSDGTIKHREPAAKSTPTVLNSQQLVGESLHILRPLVHLASLYTFGLSSWKPWLVACGLDVSSLLLMGDASQLNVEEREEMKRRTLMMLMYLLRSPFYDRYSKEKLLFFLGILAHKVPGVRLIARPLLEYLPVWQQIYFYVWAV